MEVHRTVSALRQPYYKMCEAGHIVLRVQNTAAVIFLCKDTKHLQSTFIIKINKELYVFLLLDVFWVMGNYFFLILSIDFIHWGLYKTPIVFTPIRYSQQEIYFLAEVFCSMSVGRNLIFMFQRISPRYICIKWPIHSIKHQKPYWIMCQIWNGRTNMKVSVMQYNILNKHCGTSNTTTILLFLH